MFSVQIRKWEGRSYLGKAVFAIGLSPNEDGPHLAHL